MTRDRTQWSAALCFRVSLGYVRDSAAAADCNGSHTPMREPLAFLADSTHEIHHAGSPRREVREMLLVLLRDGLDWVNRGTRLVVTLSIALRSCCRGISPPACCTQTQPQPKRQCRSERFRQCCLAA